jgi:hypothetical protein
MVEVQLTQQLIDQGAQVVSALDRAGVQPDAAFWFYFPDIRAWKLVLADVKLGSQGPREIYKRIQRTLANAPAANAISLDDVVLAKPDAAVVAVLKKAVRTGPGISGVRFTQNMIDGVLVEDAYIYRLSQPRTAGAG